MSGSRRAGPSDSLLETVLLVALGVALLASGALWLVGQVAGRLFGGAWPRTDLGAMGGVLVRLLDNPGDPAAAWPAPDRDLLPGPIGFYAVAAFIAMPVVAAGYGALWWRSRPRPTRDERSSRWATARDLRPLVVAVPGAGRLVIGRHGRRLVAAEKRQSLIVFGPTQTGKTSGLAIPAILEWDGPVVCTSVKTDLVRDTIRARRCRTGEALIFDPAGATGLPSACWTPLDAARDWQGAQRTASTLCAAARFRGSRNASDEFWQQMAAKMLAPYLFAAANAELTARDVLRWFDRRDMATPGRILDDIGETDARDAADACWSRPEEALASTYATCETILAAFADPAVDRATRRSDVRVDTLLDGRDHTLYLCAPANEQERLAPLFAALVMEVVNGIYLEAARRGKPVEPGLLLVLDEAANIAPVPRLDTIASTGAGQGLQVVSVFQDLSQVQAVYGAQHAASIVSNHRAKLVLSGIADRETLEYVGRLLGDEEVLRHSTSFDAEGRRSRSESDGTRPLAPPGGTRGLRPGHGLLVYGHLPAARIALRPWFASPPKGRRTRTRGRWRGASTDRRSANTHLSLAKLQAELE